jgi:hypothetical protein
MRSPGFIRDATALEGATRVLVVLGSVLALAAVHTASAVANLPSETDGLIAFQRNDDLHGEIWLTDPTRNGAVKVSDTAPEARPAWGPIHDPDSLGGVSDLAFQRYVGGEDKWDIWERTAEEPNVTTFHDAVPVVAEPGNQEQPAFSDKLQGASATTSLLAYVSDNTTDHAREIFLRDADGNKTQLTFDGRTAGYANPDFAGRFRPRDLLGSGTRTIGLTFEKTSGGQRGIWALDIDVSAIDGTFLTTHHPRPVAGGPLEVSEPSWQVTSPTTRTVEFNDVLFTTRENGTTYLDYVEAPASDLSSDIPFAVPAQTRRYQLTGEPGGDSGGVWAPFGDQIAFTRAFAGNADLWVMLANGTNLRRLTQDPAPDLYPTWQPAQDSSADLVGGHTYPGPVGRGGKGPNPGNTPGNPPRTNPPNPPRRRRAGLTLRGVRWHAGRVTVAGRTARGLRGRVRVAFACGRRRSQHTQRRVRARSGRFAARLRVPRACRRARRGVVAVAYGGDRRYRGQKVSRRVRRR